MPPHVIFIFLLKKPAKSLQRFHLPLLLATIVKATHRTNEKSDHHYQTITTILNFQIKLIGDYSCYLLI
jgi:hypothetical protein